MRRVLLVAGVSGAMFVASATAATAGEVTGKGDPTPIASYRAGSICSFSGLNDDPTDPEDTGRVQAFGDLVQEFVGVVGYRGASTFTEMISSEGPGTYCRGYASQ